MKPYMIAVDWLEVFCYARTMSIADQSNYERSRMSDYWLKDTGIASRSFEHITEVYTRVASETSLPVASIRWQPRSSVLNPRLCIVKLHNRVLYSQQYVKVLYAITDWLQLSIKGITRLDICYDCNEFAGGRSPYRFMKQFAFVDSDSPKFVHHVGVKSFRVYASKNPTSATSVSGIEFGSPKSEKRAYMYDKTRELAEQKDKPWIRESWQRNGLISDGSHHVYRSEISIKSDAMQVINFNTGELFRLSPHYLEAQAAVEKIFHIYASKMFDFRVKGNAKRLRDFKKVELFECKEAVSSMPKKVNRHADTGRTEKIACNLLEKYMYQYSDASQEYRYGLYSAIKFLSVVSGLKMRSSELVERTWEIAQFKGKQWQDAPVADYLSFVKALGEVQYDWSRYYQMQNVMRDIDGKEMPDDSLVFYNQYLEYLAQQ